MTIFLALGFFAIGAISMGLFIVLMGIWKEQHRAQSITRDRLPEVRNAPPPMPVCKPAREHCINCGLNVDSRCACERGRKLRDADFADVGGIEYRFMGTTGLEE